MEILKFKTNIENQDQVNQLAPILDQVVGISKWQVDPGSEDHVLSLSGESLDPQRVESAVGQVGFKAEILRVAGISGEEL